jgi:hypothetical protein
VKPQSLFRISRAKRQPIHHRRVAHLKSLREKTDGVFVVEVELIVANFLLNKPSRHEQRGPELVGFHLVPISSGRRRSLLEIEVRPRGRRMVPAFCMAGQYASFISPEKIWCGREVFTSDMQYKAGNIHCCGCGVATGQTAQRVARARMLNSSNA